ncbi:MAG: hypothetical protein HOI56_01790 [Gammaproteobacteria bacterium]|nr:hypothetical protein [Gammaproteobacteria bacterium]MBT4462001.1 hypothetical protein [Gammaproteobacteria bacterium]MBT4654513.1 hypothetical protein [Gammaproteobacteria bacterium]MBT5116769.1 hypothetical protein [Gammaproteobacteria bacterium]MBT5761454.1 hypothetical protein [Gammaproteobacteria bacterium]
MWILAKTKCRQEVRAEKNLNNQGFKCFLPTINVKKFINNVWTEKKEVMFSGYLFINIANLAHKMHKINNTYGISKLLIDKGTGSPYIINNSLIEEVSEEASRASDRDSIENGDAVVITNGKLSTFSGIFLEKCSKYRAKLLVTFLNSEQELVVDISDIQKVYLN